MRFCRPAAPSCSRTLSPVIAARRFGRYEAQALDFRGEMWYNMGAMEDVKTIVSQNISRLRKESGLTQAELAGMINYSDKAISRWETGDVLPDLETIYALAEIFGVPVSEITEKPSELPARKDSRNLSQKILSQLFLTCEIWFIIVAAFVYYKLTRDRSIWQIFVWGVPATALLIWFANRKEQNNLLLFICSTVFTWTTIACAYLHLLASNPWYIFFIGLPLQGLLIVRYIFNYKQHISGIKIPVRKKMNTEE